MSCFSELIDEIDTFQFDNLNKNHLINKNCNNTENLFNLHKKSKKHIPCFITSNLHDNKKKKNQYLIIDFTTIFSAYILLLSLVIYFCLR